jgi:hypothetical protein
MKVEDRNDQGTDSYDENLIFNTLSEVLTALRLNPQTQYSYDQWLRFVGMIGMEGEFYSTKDF